VPVNMLEELLPETIFQAVGTLSLSWAVLFACLSFKSSLRSHTTRLAAMFTILGVALFANHWTGYFATIFIVATAVSELEFLQNLAAIIRGSKEYFEYLKHSETKMAPPPDFEKVKEANDEKKTFMMTGWFQKLPEELIADGRLPLGLTGNRKVRINKAVAAQLRAATVLMDARETIPPGSEARVIMEDLVDSILSRDAIALDAAKTGLRKMRKADESKLRMFHDATRIPMRILKELGGLGPPRLDSERRDDLIISLYAEWQRLASEEKLLRSN